MPAEIKNTTPPSIGTHGGGQHPGPLAGGGGGAQNMLPDKARKSTVIMVLLFFIFKS